MKRVSVAEAKARLPELLRRAEQTPIEVTRHGVVVGAIVGPKMLQTLTKKRTVSPYRAWKQWRATIDVSALEGTDDVFEGFDERTPPPINFE